jgi:hypothetical protein
MRVKNGIRKYVLVEPLFFIHIQRLLKLELSVQEGAVWTRPK